MLRSAAAPGRQQNAETVMRNTGTGAPEEGYGEIDDGKTR